MLKRNLLFALFTFALPFAAQAQNVLLPVQGLLTDADNVAVEGSKTLQFELVGGDGAAVWNSSVNATLTGGLFTVYLGQDTELAAALFAASTDLSLKLSIDGSPLGAWPLGVAPYAAAAAFAATAGDAQTVGGQAADAFAPADNSYVVGPVQACAAGEVLKYGNAGWACGADSNDDTDTQLDETQVDAFVANNNYVVGPGQACAEGQILKYTNGGWACGADANDNNTYTAGNAISLSNEGQFYISAGAIGQSEIGADAVRASELADNSVDLAAMRDNSVGAAEIINNSVNNAELGDNAVGRAEMQDDAVGTAELANGAVTRGKLGASGCTNGQILKYGGNGWACSADADTNTTYSAGTGLQLVGTSFRLATSGVTATHLAANSVGASEMADNAIGLAEMQNNSVGAAELRSGSVDTAELVDGSVTNAKLASGIDRAKVSEHRVIYVPATGTTTANGTALITAYTAANATCSSPKTIKLSAGTYDLGSNWITMDQCMIIEGAGQKMTTIKSSNSFGRVLKGNVSSIVRNLAIEGRGMSGNTYAYVVYNTSTTSRWYGGRFKLEDVYISATSGTSDNTNHVVLNDGQMALHRVTIYMSIGGSGSHVGVRSTGSGDEIDIYDSRIYLAQGSGSGARYGLYASGGAWQRTWSSYIYIPTGNANTAHGVYSTGAGSWNEVASSSVYAGYRAGTESSSGNIVFLGSKITNNEGGGVKCSGTRKYGADNNALNGDCD